MRRRSQRSGKPEFCMKAIDAFSPLGVVDLTSDGVEVEPSFEPAFDPGTVLGKQLSSLQKYLSEGGVANRLQERARELEIRSSDPVWLVVEASLDSAWRITSGLEIFSESLGVYLEYEFTKVQLYDALITRLEQGLAEY